MSLSVVNKLSSPLLAIPSTLHFQKRLNPQWEVKINFFFSPSPSPASLKDLKGDINFISIDQSVGYASKTPLLINNLIVSYLKSKKSVKKEFLAQQIIHEFFFHSLTSLKQRHLEILFQRRIIKSIQDSSLFIPEQMKRWLDELLLLPLKKRKYGKEVVMRMGFHLIHLVDALKNSQKPLFINTLIAIGKKLVKQNVSFPYYSLRKKGNNPRFSFLILPEGRVYVTLKRIASGSFKQVNECVDLYSLEPYAQLILKNEEAIKIGWRERRLLKDLHRHPSPYFAPPFFSSCEVGHRLILLQTRYTANAFIFKYQSKHQMLAVVKICAQALADLHHRQLAFLDFKFQNVLINFSPSQGLDVRLCDFGAVRTIGEEAAGSTLAFMPWEAFSGALRADIKWDSYALGASIIRLLFKKNKKVRKLFAYTLAATPYKEIKRLLVSLKKTSSDSETVIHNFLLALALRLIIENPLQRISCAQAVESVETFSRNF